MTDEAGQLRHPPVNLALMVSTGWPNGPVRRWYGQLRLEVSPLIRCVRARGTGSAGSHQCESLAAGQRVPARLCATFWSCS
jgi:hypothetical protein